MSCHGYIYPTSHIFIYIYINDSYIDEVPTANLKPDHERHTTFYSACQVSEQDDLLECL